MKKIKLKILPTNFSQWLLVPPEEQPLMSISSIKGDNRFIELLSSVYGRIMTVVLFFPAKQEIERKRRMRYLEFLEELLAKMKGGGRSFILIVEDDLNLSKKQKACLEKAAEKGNNVLHIEYVKYPNGSIAPWAQDGFLPAIYRNNETGEEHKTFVVPHAVDRNKGMAEKLSKALPSIPCNHRTQWFQEYRKTTFSFEGGNVLVGDDYILVGPHGIEPDVTADDLTEAFGKQVILFPPQRLDFKFDWNCAHDTEDRVYNYYQASEKTQCIYHLDIAFTLGGKDEQGRELFVIGQPTLGFDLEPDTADDIKAMVLDLITETSKALEKMIDFLEKELKRLSIDYKIYRIPLPLSYYDHQEGNKPKRYWAWTTYNNCLVECYKDEAGNFQKYVVLPSYGYSSDYRPLNADDCPPNEPLGDWTELHRYDLEVEAFWKSLGYEVTHLKNDYNPFVRYLGSLNCLTNCIDRSPKYP